MDSSAWDERYRDTDRLWSRGPNLFLEDRLAGAAPGEGIDLAGGEGRNAIWLADQGWKMASVDFSQVASERGRSAESGVDFIEADVLEWEPESKVDLVVIAYLHLQPELFERVVRRARGWLRPGGELFMIGHDVSNIDKGYGGPQYPDLLWDVPLIEEWVDGMVIIEAVVVRRPVETDEGRTFARDALVRARAPQE